MGCKEPSKHPLHHLEQGRGSGAAWGRRCLGSEQKQHSMRAKCGKQLAVVVAVMVGISANSVRLEISGLGHV